MAYKSLSDLAIFINNTFYTNAIQDISGDDVHTGFTDFKDSFWHKSEALPGTNIGVIDQTITDPVRTVNMVNRKLIFDNAASYQIKNDGTISLDGSPIFDLETTSSSHAMKLFMLKNGLGNLFDLRADGFVRMDMNVGIGMDASEFYRLAISSGNVGGSSVYIENTVVPDDIVPGAALHVYSANGEGIYSEAGIYGVTGNGGQCGGYFRNSVAGGNGLVAEANYATSIAGGFINNAGGASIDAFGYVVVREGSINLQFGKRIGNSAQAALYAIDTPTSTNYRLLFNTDETNINASTNVNVEIGGTQAFNVNASAAYVPSGRKFGVSTSNPTSTLHVAGSMALALPVTKTANYTVAATDYVIHFTANNNTCNLPDAALFPGRILKVKNTAGLLSVQTIDGFGSQTIDGSTTLAVANGTVVTIQSNGVNWITI